MVEYMGGAAAILSRAKADIDKGEFRFAAQALSHLVFAEPGNVDARAALADAFEQMGYLTESATWRNAYLFGAHELRHGLLKMPPRPTISRDTAQALRTSQLFDYFAVRLNGPKADGRHIVLNWRFTDTGEDHVLNLENSALTQRGGVGTMARQSASAHATVELKRAALDRIIQGLTTFPEAMTAGEIRVTGDASKLIQLLSLLDEFPRMFEISAPKPTLDAERT
jgi:alkyl sulfatase BDS1-like metallo-beta-lactamase superfamily hydrolase